MAAQFWSEHRELLDETANRYDVAPQYLVAILGVETSYGRITGRYRVLDALSDSGVRLPATLELLQRRAASSSSCSRARSRSMR